MSIKNIFIKYKIEFLRVYYYIIDLFYPKNRNIYIIGANSGEYLNGNAKVMYNYLNNEGYEVYFLSYKNYKDIKTVNENTKEGLKSILKAGTFLITHGDLDIGRYWNSFMKRRRIVFLWHGLPFKNEGIFNKELNNKQLKKLIKSFNKYSLFISTSEIINYIYISSYKIPEHKLIITGYPRNDLLFNCNQNEIKSKIVKKIKKINISEKSKFILYAPTFRSWKDTEYFPFKDFDKAKLKKFLEDNDIFIFIRSHRNEKFDSSIYSVDNIIDFSDNKAVDINEYLGAFDLLITDYSSIFQDFLFLNKPILFIPYDLDEYIEKRGIYFDYNDFTPGHKIYSFDMFLKVLEDIFIKNIDSFKKQREILRKVFYKHFDNKATERVVNIIVS